ncbi:MAG: 3'(2'),5'-bisphosphate nucleotidase CysQ [Dehalococcoidia bacterium]|nr:3'(2'),5'-bisphosphate nucleotidase CysQ [Dehalococcoidia bacterium]
MLEQELQVARAAARAAGDEVRRMREAGLRFGYKDGRELVSEADLRAAEMLHAALTAAFPHDGWLGEEHADSDDRLPCERVWVVDPIDGTREYLQGIPEYAVSVGLVVEGHPALGVVYNPATAELYGAVCLGVGERPPRAGAATFDVLVGRSEHRWQELPPLPVGARPRGVGSVAYRLALLAAGRGDAVLTGYGRAEWDVAAGAALCLAAGLRVTGVLGDGLRFNQPDPYVRGLLAAEPGLHAHLAGFFQRLA